MGEKGGRRGGTTRTHRKMIRMERDERSCGELMSAKLLVYASNYSNRRKNDSFESGLGGKKGNQSVETGGKRIKGGKSNKFYKSDNNEHIEIIL